MKTKLQAGDHKNEISLFEHGVLIFLFIGLFVS